MFTMFDAVFPYFTMFDNCSIVCYWFTVLLLCFTEFNVLLCFDSFKYVVPCSTVILLCLTTFDGGFTRESKARSAAGAAQRI